MLVYWSEETLRSVEFVQCTLLQFDLSLTALLSIFIQLSSTLYISTL